jgi:hypothetical protein
MREGGELYAGLVGDESGRGGPHPRPLSIGNGVSIGMARGRLWKVIELAFSPALPEC